MDPDPERWERVGPHHLPDRIGISIQGMPIRIPIGISSKNMHFFSS
jgi:hypothetical protein